MQYRIRVTAIAIGSSIVIAFVTGALDGHAQISVRSAEQCFADPTVACLMDQAMAMLNESEYPDPDALLDIAAVLAKAGKIDRAQLIFMRALDTMMLMGWPEMRGAMFMHAVEMTVTVLHAEEARSVLTHAEGVAREMELPDVRAMALQAIARMELDAGRSDRARDVLDEALDVAMGIPWDELRRSQFTMIVDQVVGKLPEELARPVFEHALELVDDVIDGFGAGIFWAEMASAQARLGEVDAALEMADGIDNLAWRRGARAQIAGALAARGELDRAMEIARAIDDDYQRNRGFAEIAEALAGSGELSRARAAAEGITDAELRERVISGISSVALDENDLGQALEAALSMSESTTRTQAVIDLAFEFGGPDIDTESQRQLVEALLATRQMTIDAGGHWTDLYNITTALSVLGETSEALATADAIDEVDRRHEALASVASSAAYIGNVESAEAIVADIEALSSEPGILDEPLASIAAARAEAGDIDGALTLIERIEEPGVRAAALARIAATLPE
jgi:tetratricopeptide (TPR) repeat protein